MPLSHTLMPSLVLFDALPEIHDRVRMEVNYGLHGIRVQCPGTYLNLFVNKEKHCFDMNMAIDVGLHVLSIELQVLLGVNMLHCSKYWVISYQTWNLCLVFLSVSPDGIPWVLTLKSKLLYTHRYEAWMFLMNEAIWLLFWINIQTLTFSKSAYGLIFFTRVRVSPLYHIVESCTNVMEARTFLRILKNSRLCHCKSCKRTTSLCMITSSS